MNRKMEQGGGEEEDKGNRDQGKAGRRWGKGERDKGCRGKRKVGRRWGKDGGIGGGKIRVKGERGSKLMQKKVNLSSR